MNNRILILITLYAFLTSFTQKETFMKFSATSMLYCSDGKCDDAPKRKKFEFKFYPDKKLEMMVGESVFNYKIKKLVDTKVEGNITIKHFTAILESYKDPKVNSKKELADITIFIEDSNVIQKIILKGKSKKEPGRKDEFTFTN